MASASGSEKTSVQVALRIRPITNEDTANLPTRFQRQILTASGSNQVIVQADKKQAFNYDFVFGPEATQQEVYDKAVVKLVNNFLEGYNVTILAYGQTSSGKTHTMGTADSHFIPSESKGIIPRAMQTLFSLMNSSQYKSRKFSLKVSFIEIYNEDLIDLLDDSYGDSKSQVTIREDVKGNILWSGLQEIKVNCVDDVIGHLARGSANRQVGATDMNAQSSRSHAIFSVTMIQQKLVNSSTTQTSSRPSTPSKMLEPKFGIRSQSSLNNLRVNRRIEEGEFVTLTSKFHFVDLAGSERLKRSAAVGERAKEGISINSGLLALGNVISALGDPSKAKHTTHIPYRDSKLTRLLQDSLGGNAQTLMIACVSPAEYNLNETVNTLKYANRARNIKNTVLVNQEEVGWHDLEHLQNLVLKLRSEIKSLKSTTCNSNNGSNNSSGRNTPTLTPDTLPPPSRLRPKSPLTVITTNINPTTTNNKYKDIEDLEGQYLQLKHSYAELSQKHAKTSAELAIYQDNSDEISGDLKANGIDKKDLQHNSSFQEAVEPVVEEYEKSISSLESQLALARAALNHSEKMMHDQEAKIDYAEQLNEQNKNLIIDLRNKIGQLCEREENAERYIKDLESKLEVHLEEQKKDQELIIELKSKLSQLKSNGSNSEGYIQDLESRLASSEEQSVKLNLTIERLEKRLQQREVDYAELETKMRQANTDEEKKMLLGEIDERDRRIIQLEQKVNELVIELEKLRLLKVREHELNVRQATHQQSNSIISLTSEDERLFTYTPIANGLSLKDEQDRLLVIDLEKKLTILQLTHEKTVEEFAEIKAKYQACLDEINELQAQLNEARMVNSELFDNFRCATPSTPMTPISPQSTSSPIPLQTPLRFEEYPIDSGLIAVKKRELHRKSKSLSGDIRGSEKRDLAHLAIVQKLQMELKQLEDKTIGMDSFNKEFARLQMSHRATLEIVEELREEIKKRDAIAQLEVMSIVKAEHSNQLSSTFTELDELEIVNRLRKEVENLKEEQRRTIEKISEYEKMNNGKSEEILQIELRIQSLRDQLHQAIQEQNIVNDVVTIDDKAIEGLQITIKELEHQLLKIQENQRLEKIAETTSKLEGKILTKPDENVKTPLELPEKVKDEIKTLYMGVEKLQVEIEAKSHTIAALLLPNDDRLSTIRKLESEIQEAKQAIEEENSKINGNNDSDSISDVNSSDKLEQNVDEHVKALEEKVKNLELQLSKMKEVNHIPTSRNSALHIIDPTQKSVEALQTKLIALQEQLASKSGSIENMQNVKDLVIALQSQLEILKADLKRKYELIEILKKDLVDKGVLQQKLREKEIEASMLKAQLSEVKNRQEDMQKQMLEIQIQLQGVDNSKDPDQSLQSEINNVKRELQEVKEKESSSLKYLQKLEAEESKLKQEVQRLKNGEITQKERINFLEAQLLKGDGNIEEDITKLKAELVLAKESEAEYKSKISELEIKLNKSEDDFAALRSKVDLLKSKALGKSTQIQNYEHQFNSTAVSTLEIEIGELKDMKFKLQKTVKELEIKLEIAQKESDKLQGLKSEIASLKEFESKHKNVIEQLQSQIKVISGEKDNVLTELEGLRKEYNTQKEYIISLEIELNNVKAELSEAKESNVISSKKLDDLSRLLGNTEQQRDKELKKIKVLENQIQVSRDIESEGKDALEIETQNGFKNELKDKIQALEKERDQYAKRVTELTKTFETKEIEQKQTVATLKSSIIKLESKLAEVKSSSQFDQNTITTLGNKLASVGALFGEAKASEDKHIRMTRELEDKLKEANTTLLIKEKMIISKDASISELEVALQKTRKDLEDAKLSTNSETKHVKELQTRLYELETKLLERPSSSELEAAKKTAAKQSELVKELEMKLASMEQFSPSGITSNVDAITLVTDQLNEAKFAEAIQVELVKRLEITLKDKQENLEKLQDTMAKVNSELEAVKKSEMEHKELIKTLEAQLKVAERNHNSKTSSPENDNVEIEILDDTQEEAIIINSYSNIDNNNDVIENLESQLNEAHNKAKAYSDRVEELEKITKQLEVDNKNQLNVNADLTKQIEHYQKDLENLTEEVEETTTKYKDVDVISKEQKIRIAELEKAFEEIQGPDGMLPSHRSNDSLTDSFDTYGSSSNSTLSKLAVANENLRQINDNLRAKVSSAEDHVASLKNSNRNLEKELSHMKNILNGVTVEDLKEKITELEAEKEGLEQANNSFKEECKKLDQKVESLVKQFQLAGRGGNKSAAQLAELNYKLMTLEREYTNLKQKSLVDAQGMEDEITNLLNIKEHLEKEIDELNGKPFNSKNLGLKSHDTPKLNGSDNFVKSKLKRQENTIAQQNSLIKVLQDKINDLERRMETETKYRRPSFGSISITDHDGPFGSTGARLSSSSNRSILPNIIAASNLIKSPPPTPPPNQPLPPTPPPNQPLPPTPDSLPSPRLFTPPSSRLLHSHSRSGSNYDTSTDDLTTEIQKLHRKIAKIEGENIENKRLVETLENSLDESEGNLKIAEKQLRLLQDEKKGLAEKAKTLQSQLNETKTQFENARSSVYEEKKVIETVLEEERKAKENAEKERRQLESRMEELMAKKKTSFLHPIMKSIIQRSKPHTKHHHTSSATSFLSEGSI